MKSSKPVLIACECSQTECMAWRNAGYEAFSCDIQSCHGPHPEWHLCCDVLDVLVPGRWGLIIAHPPCTYLSAVGARWLDSPGRRGLMADAADFFMKFYNFRDCPMAIENPRPLHAAGLPPYSQVVCPSLFGSSWTKRTCLWLFDLPPLLPTTARGVNLRSWHANHSSQYTRSLGFSELANAYVSQWGRYVL